MKTLVLYGSSRGSTERVVQKLPDYLSFPLHIRNVKELQNDSLLLDYQLLLLFAPTYGDEELQEDMERFLVNCRLDLSRHYYALCELGNYYGYDDFSYGAMPIMHHHMQLLGSTELLPPLSMDSLPKKDWLSLEKWCHLLNERYHHARH